MKKQRNHYSEPEIFVADTHALMWYLTEDESLSKKAWEIFDRIIVATARLLDAKLITKDIKIAISKEVDVVW